MGTSAKRSPRAREAAAAAHWRTAEEKGVAGVNGGRRAAHSVQKRNPSRFTEAGVEDVGHVARFLIIARSLPGEDI